MSFTGLLWGMSKFIYGRQGQQRLVLTSTAVHIRTMIDGDNSASRFRLEHFSLSFSTFALEHRLTEPALISTM